MEREQMTEVEQFENKSTDEPDDSDVDRYHSRPRKT